MYNSNVSNVRLVVSNYKCSMNIIVETVGDDLLFWLLLKWKNTAEELADTIKWLKVVLIS